VNQQSDRTAKKLTALLAPLAEVYLLSRTRNLCAIQFWLIHFKKDIIKRVCPEEGNQDKEVLETMSYPIRTSEAYRKITGDMTSVCKYPKSCHMQKGVNLFCTVPEVGSSLKTTNQRKIDFYSI